MTLESVLSGAECKEDASHESPVECGKFILIVCLKLQVEGVIKDIRNAVDPYANDGCTSHASDFPGFEVSALSHMHLTTTRHLCVPL